MGEIENFPKNIGRYEIKALLGAGAMGSVYLAEDPRIKRKLAIKVVKMDSIRTEADRQEFLARFQREAEVSGVLNDPGIVTIYDVGDSEVGPFLAMEFVPGRTLEHIIKAGEALPLPTKLAIAAGIAAALDHAHTHGIVHRDVKPGNVMITAENRPKLMDFGIAKREDASLTQTGTFLGTPSYASPEQIREGVATSQSDVFSFGVMMFELLSGSLPFPGNSINTILYRIVNEPPVDIKPPVEGLVPEGWQRTFNKVLAKNPGDRHANCSAFVRELVDTTMDLGKTDRMQLLGSLRPGTRPTETQRSSLDPAAPPVPPVPAAAPPAKGNPSLVYGAAGALVLAAALGGFLLFRKSGAQVILDTVPTNAAVLKGGKELGRTPLPLLLQPGEEVTFDRKGFQSKAYTFKAGDGAPKVALDPVTSDETLRTDPPGATVVLDEVVLPGVTPLLVKGWNQGRKHALNFKKGALGLSFDLLEGEIPGTQIYTLMGAGETRTGAVPKAVDANAPGSIRNTGDFPVRVRLDGKDLGELRPGATVPAPPGPHRLELSQPSVYFKETRQIQVNPGQAAPLTLPGVVHLTVETYPSSATVMVDGISTQVDSDGSQAITLTRGHHTITIKDHPGVTRHVDLQADGPLKFKL
jgi:tRNA A-37 threonylcarbamoyl transferase component Bud32